jgi:hypothetical protein
MLLAVVAVSTVAGYRFGYLEAADEAQAAVDAYKQRVDDANYRAASASFRYEEWKDRQQLRSTELVKEVKRAANSPEARDWSAARLPDGVRNAATKAAAELGAGEPAAAVPTVRTPRSADEREPS